MSGDEDEALGAPAGKALSGKKPSHEEALKKAEPFIRLARLGAERWNRWIRSVVDEEQAKKLGIEGIEKLSEEELGQLAKDAGIEGLPVIGLVEKAWAGPLTFANVDFRKIEPLPQFAGFAFPNSTTFRGALFSDGADFSGARFGDEACITNARFGDEAFFSGARFGSWARFDGACFGYRARFDGASFGDDARFDGASFGDDARFDGASFGDEARFDWARFAGPIYFGLYRTQGSRDTPWKFASRIRFDDASRQTLIDEHVEEAVGDAFSGIFFPFAHFEGVADFSGRRFEGPVSFRSATFVEVPELANVEGAGRIDPSGMTISFTGRLRVSIIDRDMRVRLWTTDSWIPARIRRLRKIMADINAHDIERDLFILEKKADRGVLWALGGWRNRLRSLAWIVQLAIYGVFSDCGRSLVRPVAWMALAWAGFRLLYPELGVGETSGPMTPDQAALLERDLSSFTTGNMLPFVSGLSPARTELLKRLFGEGIAIPGAVEWAAIAQNATGAVLLFLLLLAIRNRFRVG